MLYAQFAGLLLLITIGAALLSEGAETVAEKYGANFAGSIILALITTLPEYLFVIFATLKDRPEVALGSAIGACTLLVTLGYGSVILVATSRLSKSPVPAIELSNKTRIDAVYLLVTAVLALALAIEGGGLDVKDAVILTICFALYVIEHSRVARHTARTVEHSVTARDIIRAGVLFFIGGVIVFLCSDPFVDAMVGIARDLGVSAMSIALVVSPIASEMPEKLTAYVTVRRDGRLAEISIANFMGSKVNHNSLLLAVLVAVSVYRGHGSVQDVVNIPFLVMTALTVFAGLNLMQRRLTRTAGWVFLALYALIIFAAVHTGTSIAH